MSKGCSCQPFRNGDRCSLARGQGRALAEAVVHTPVVAWAWGGLLEEDLGNPEAEAGHAVGAVADADTFEDWGHQEVLAWEGLWPGWDLCSQR